MTRLPFQKDAACPKCGNDWLMNSYHNYRTADRDGEYLQFRCPSCGYEWQTQTADAWAVAKTTHICGECVAFRRAWCHGNPSENGMLYSITPVTPACVYFDPGPTYPPPQVLTDQELFTALMTSDMASIKRIRASHNRLRQLLELRDAGLGNDDATRAEIAQVLHD